MFGFEISLPNRARPLQVGLACIRISNSTADWSWDDLYVANDLRGGGFTGLLLDQLLERLTTLQCQEAIVRFERRELQEAGNRRQIVELADFYRSRGFEWQPSRSMKKKLKA